MREKEGGRMVKKEMPSPELARSKPVTVGEEQREFKPWGVGRTPGLWTSLGVVGGKGVGEDSRAPSLSDR